MESEYLDEVFKGVIWDCREAAIKNLDGRGRGLLEHPRYLVFKYSVEICSAPAIVRRQQEDHEGCEGVQREQKNLKLEF